jgi:hypothetical protein
MSKPSDMPRTFDVVEHVFIDSTTDPYPPIQCWHEWFEGRCVHCNITPNQEELIAELERKLSRAELEEKRLFDDVQILCAEAVEYERRIGVLSSALTEACAYRRALCGESDADSDGGDPAIWDALLKRWLAALAESGTERGGG